MNRPRLPFVIEYFTSLQKQSKDLTIIEDYNTIKKDQGEFLAGRFIIEVYLETQKELRDAKEKARI